VCELEQDLRELGDIERQKIARLMDTTVRVVPSDVDPPKALRGIGTRLPQDGRVERSGATTAHQRSKSPLLPETK